MHSRVPLAQGTDSSSFCSVFPGFLRCPGVPALRVQMRTPPRRLLRLCPSKKTAVLPISAGCAAETPAQSCWNRAPGPEQLCRSRSRRAAAPTREGQPFAAMQSCPAEPRAARRHRGHAAGMEPSASRSSVPADATTARPDAPRSRGTARSPSMASVEPLWPWHGVGEPGPVPVL